jgi:hypothetical protein
MRSSEASASANEAGVPGPAGEALPGWHDRSLAARQRFREIAMRQTPRAKIQEWAEKLGLAVADSFTQVGEAELAFAGDLAIYTAPPGRSRGVDRMAKQFLTLQSEATLVLNGLLGAWFSLFRVLGPHPEAGFILEDALRGGEVWVLDQGLAESAAPGAILAARLARVCGFAITTGVHAVIDEARLASTRAILERSGLDAAALAEDPRFITALWQHALQT